MVVNSVFVVEVIIVIFLVCSPVPQALVVIREDQLAGVVGLRDQIFGEVNNCRQVSFACNQSRNNSVAPVSTCSSHKFSSAIGIPALLWFAKIQLSHFLSHKTLVIIPRTS